MASPLAPIASQAAFALENARLYEELVDQNRQRARAEEQLRGALTDLERATRLKAMGLSILLIEHHMELVMGVCDRVVVLNFGRKIAEGAPETVQNDEHVRAAYLGSDGSDDLMHAALAA